MNFKQNLKNLLHRKVRISKLELDVLAFVYIFIGIALGVILVASGIFRNLSALILTTKTIESSTSFNQGTSSDISVVGSGDSAYIQLAGEEGAWYDTNWVYRYRLTFNNTSHSSNLTDFPVLVKLTASNFNFAHAKSDGADVRFTDSNGTSLLEYEIEKWDSVGQEALVWVKVPQIDASSNTDFVFAYTGNPAASDAQNVNSTWDSNYIMVQHLDQAGANGDPAYIDSTADGLIGTANNFAGTPESTTDFQGQIGKGVKPNGEGASIDFGSNTAFSNLGSGSVTTEAWIYWDGVGNGSAIVNKGQPFWSDGDMPIYFGIDEPTGALYYIIGETESDPNVIYVFNNTTGIVTPNTWIYVVGQINTNDDTLKLYMNGNLIASIPNTVTDEILSNEPLRIGKNMGGNDLGSVGVDELRISDSARSEDWINATYMSENNTFITFSGELQNLATTGTWESPEDSNTIDLVWNGGWGDGTEGSTAFEASTENIGVSANIVFQMRVADTIDNLLLASYQTIGTATSGSTFTQTKADLDTAGLDVGGNRYAQVKATLNSLDGSTNPHLLDFTISYLADNTNPGTNAADIIMERTNGGDDIAASGWTNNPAPFFSWIDGEDSQSGIAGYCAYLGTDIGGDPVLTKGLLGNGNLAIETNPCPFSVSTNSIDFATTSFRGVTWLSTSNSPYYLNIKAIDKNGNTAGTITQFAFKYDTVAPSNPTYFSLPSDFVSSKDVSIIWPSVGSDSASDLNSGVGGLQYKIGSGGTWYGDIHNGAQDFTDKLVNDGTYTTNATYDYPLLNEGANQIFMRTVDAAGNISATVITGVLKLNTVAPSSPQNLIADPTDNTTNSYAFSWDAPNSFTGQVNKITYCYTVNVLPSSINCNYTSQGVTTLAADAYANQPGVNTMYVVARDEALNINYATYTSTTFTYSGSAPGIPQNLDVSDISIKETSNWRLSLSWEEPSAVGAGIATYRVYRSTGTASCTENFGDYAQVGSVGNTSTFFADSGLTQTNYKYCIKACDSASSCSAVSSTVTGFPNGKFVVPAELTSGPSVDAITSRSARITWTTARNSDTKVAYGLASNEYFEEEPSISAPKTDHGISLNSLNPGTLYYYRAKWTDEDGNTGESLEKQFVTLPPPVVKDVSVIKVGLDNALIKFSVSGASKVRILYGKSESFGGVQEIATSIVETIYTALLTNLEDGTKYFYKIVPVDIDEFEYSGTVLDFATVARPKLSNITVEEVRNVSQPTVKVDWESNTEVSSIITYSPEDGSVPELDAVDLTFKSGPHTLNLKSLKAETKYSMKVRGIDKLGNEAISDIQNFTTSTDTRPPTINNLKVDSIITNIGESSDKQKAQLIISWDTDELATSQVEYGQGSSGSYPQTTSIENNLKTNHLVVISNLTPSQVYNFRVVSRDSANNESKSIDTVAITPKVTSSILDLVTSNLLEIFRFLR